jgi:hypothetical protein
MSKELTGLFIGAGASFDASMPLVWELTSYLKSWLTTEKINDLNAGWELQGGGFPEEVIKDFILVWSRRDMHYESVLGYLETQSKRMRSLSVHYHGLYIWLVQTIYYKLYGDHIQNKEQILKSLDLYKGIEFLYLKNKPLWVFSLNHDSIVEAVAAHFQIPVYSGFSKKKIKLPRRRVDGTVVGAVEAETIEREVMDNGAMFFPNPGEQGIYLLKLHGALDMFVYNDAGDMLKMLPETLTPSGVIDVLRIANDELLYADSRVPGGIVRACNEIAYADFDGQMNFLRRTLLSGAQKFHEHGTQVLPKSMLKHFRANLNFLGRLICIGYGFGDHHVNESISNWLSFSAERKLDIVGPGVTSVPSFLLHLANQVELVDSGATEYLDAVAGIERSELTKLETTLWQLKRKIGAEKSAVLIEEFRAAEELRLMTLMSEKLLALANADKLEDREAINELTEQMNTEIARTSEDTLRRILDYLVLKS